MNEQIKTLDDIDQFCADIRHIVNNAQLSDKDGRSDMRRDVGIRLENIEGKVADLRGRPPEKKADGYHYRAPYFKEDDVVRYRGALCRVVAVLDRASPGDTRPWYFYDLKEELGDGEYNDVDESSILRRRDTATKNKKKAQTYLQRFFHFVDVHGNDVWINVFRIDYVIGKEVTMDTGKMFALTREEADSLTALIGCVNPDRAEEPA